MTMQSDMMQQRLIHIYIRCIVSIAVTIGNHQLQQLRQSLLAVTRGFHHNVTHCIEKHVPFDKTSGKKSITQEFAAGVP